ncbi:MAG: M6 family metalloprotease domain-containing protein, partial [Elusimicrobia bacterium]|nr:M6 family metalloprotease domain-containing protein [Elusimicrobiota bacterium]
MRNRLICAALIIAAGAGVCELAAAPAFRGGPGPREYVNLPEGISIQEHRAKIKGTKKVVVIPVEFSGAGIGTSGNNTMTTGDMTNIDGWFVSDSKNFEDYYDKASYGDLDLEVYFAAEDGIKTEIELATQCFTLTGHSMGWYGEDENSYPERLAILIRDAINAANEAGVKVTTGAAADEYDYVIVAHAGNGNESTYPDYPGDIWSVSMQMAQYSTYGFTTGAIVPAREYGTLEPFGVICHEFGHQLGLPDIYAPDTGEEVVGDYALMDVGSWNDGGKTPPHPCSWSKAYLGWVAPEVLEGNSLGLRINPYYSTESDSVYKVIVPGTGELEYFLMSYRKKGGDYDTAGGVEWGVVILHIDDDVGEVADNDVNSSTQEHPRIDIVGKSIWDTDEAFASPDSDGYEGTISGITLLNFEEHASYMTFDATVANFTEALAFKEAPVNFPNPAVGAASTTISFMMTNLENDNEIRIYSAAGELVKKIDSEDISLVGLKSNEAVYQAVWNLDNEASNRVASGIYFYIVESGDK